MVGKLRLLAMRLGAVCIWIIIDIALAMSSSTGVLLFLFRPRRLFLLFHLLPGELL